MADSSTGGYLRPTNTAVTYEEIEDALHDLVVGITGLADDLVRPRWQPEPPKQPARNSDWCSIGIITRRHNNFSPVIHNNPGDGSDSVLTFETLEILASFYGPGSHDLAETLRDGLYVAQNREAVKASVGLVLTEIQEFRTVPELINTSWVRRVDVPIIMGRAVQRDYAVLHILRGGATIESDNGLIVQTTCMQEGLWPPD